MELEGLREEASALLRLLFRRYERGSVIIASNKGFADWGEIFSDTVPATAILYRLLHHSATINIKGESFRLKEKRRAGMLSGAKEEPKARVEEEEADISGDPAELELAGTTAAS